LQADQLSSDLSILSIPPWQVVGVGVGTLRSGMAERAMQRFVQNAALNRIVIGADEIRMEINVDAVGEHRFHAIRRIVGFDQAGGAENGFKEYVLPRHCLSRFQYPDLSGR
jgi:hypothetical protein